MPIDRVPKRYDFFVGLFLIVALVVLVYQPQWTTELPWNWTVFALCAFALARYLHYILRNEDPALIMHAWVIIITVAAFFASTREYLSRFSWAHYVTATSIGIGLVAFIVGLYLSADTFGRVNSFGRSKRLLVFSFVLCLDIVLFSSIFDLPLPTIAQARGDFQEAIFQILPTTIAGVTSAAFWEFATLGFVIRCLVVSALLLSAALYRAVHHMKKLPTAWDAGFAAWIPLSLDFADTFVKSFRPTGQILWYINRHVAANGICWVVYFGILDALFFGISAIQSVASDSPVSITFWADAGTILGAWLITILLLPILVFLLTKVAKGFFVGILKNLSSASVKVTYYLLLFLGITSLLTSTAIICLLAFHVDLLAGGISKFLFPLDNVSFMLPVIILFGILLLAPRTYFAQFTDVTRWPALGVIAAVLGVIAIVFPLAARAASAKVLARRGISSSITFQTASADVKEVGCNPTATFTGVCITNSSGSAVSISLSSDGVAWTSFQMRPDSTDGFSNATLLRIEGHPPCKERFQVYAAHGYVVKAGQCWDISGPQR
jgi:hypothetical protein